MRGARVKLLRQRAQVLTMRESKDKVTIRPLTLRELKRRWTLKGSI
jgi:predicted transcriptional regulator of viral defense system